MTHRFPFAALTLFAVLGVNVRAQQGEAVRPLPELVAGIVHYTRWPDPPATLRLCVEAGDELADGDGARQLFEALALLPERRVSTVARRIAGATAASLQDCQAIYFGQVSSASWRYLLQELANQPVLTIGPGEDFCSWGGVFCLERAGASVRIKANLDAVARSGLRVNPQLLRLTQRGKVAR